MSNPHTRALALRLRTPVLALLVVGAACGESVAPDGPVAGFIDLDPAAVPDHLTLVDQTAEHALLLGREGRVANLVLWDLAYDQQLGAEWGAPEAQRLTRILYTRFRDAFDFVLITYDDRHPREVGPYGRYVRVQLGVDGLAIGPSREGRRYGLTGVDDRLLGVTMLHSQRSLINGPSLHEITHQWGQRLIRDSGFPGHWGAAGVGGQLGGWTPGTLTRLDDGEWTGLGPTGRAFGFIANGGNRNVPYAPLELYIMGLLPADSVAPVLVAVDPVVVDTLGGRFTASGFRWFDLQDHVQEFGPRTPGYPEAPRHFRGLYVILTRATPLPEEDWRRATADAEQFARPGPDDDDGVMNFWEATGGRATFQLDGLFDELRPDSN